jgi:hypothetical protein
VRPRVLQVTLNRRNIFTTKSPIHSNKLDAG